MSGGAMGDQNAPERIGISETRAGIKYVTASAYDRAIAERDEARAQCAALRDRYSTAVIARNEAQIEGAKERTRADRYCEALEFYADEENYNEAGAVFRRFDRVSAPPAERVDRGWTARDALAEGEQPAGETTGEAVTDRMVREAEHSFRRASWHPSRDTIRDGLAAALAVRPAAGVQSTTETGADLSFRARVDSFASRVGLSTGQLEAARDLVTDIVDEVLALHPSPSTTETATASRCAAKLYHGPGHMSGAPCEVVGPHEIHSAHYCGVRGTWRGEEGFTGPFDEPPDADDEDNEPAAPATPEGPDV